MLLRRSEKESLRDDSSNAWMIKMCVGSKPAAEQTARTVIQHLKAAWRSGIWRANTKMGLETEEKRVSKEMRRIPAP